MTSAPLAWRRTPLRDRTVTAAHRHAEWWTEGEISLSAGLLAADRYSAAHYDSLQRPNGGARVRLPNPPNPAAGRREPGGARLADAPGFGGLGPVQRDRPLRRHRADRPGHDHGPREDPAHRAPPHRDPRHGLHRG